MLFSRRFFPLFVTQFLGALNDNIFKTALIILITYTLAEASEGTNQAITVTLAAGLFILPFFLFSATAGTVADAYEKSMLIRMIKGCEIIIMLGASIGFFFESQWLLMTVLFLMGTQSAFFGPLKYAILPEHLHSDELISGNAWVEAATFLAILLGTIIGGIFIVETQGTWLISGIILCVAAMGFIASFYIPKTRQPNPDTKPTIEWNIITGTCRMLRYAYGEKQTFPSILAISWFWLVGSIILAQLPIYSSSVLNGDNTVLTLLMTVFSLGIGCGSFGCSIILKGKIHARYVAAAALGMSAFLVDWCWISQYYRPEDIYDNYRAFMAGTYGWRVCLDLFLLGVCGGMYIVPLYAIMQDRSSDTHRARIIASNNIINASFMVIAAIFMMVLLHLGFSIVEIFFLTATGNALVALWIWRFVSCKG